jgi:hypothetical protein
MLTLEQVTDLRLEPAIVLRSSNVLAHIERI